MSRAEILTRARSWLHPAVAYSSTGYHDNEFGSYRTDCSGYVAMAWALPGRPLDPSGGVDTLGLVRLSTAVTKADLRPGDALVDCFGIVPERHVTLFERWVDSSRTVYWGYEQAIGSGAVHRQIPYPYEQIRGLYLPCTRRNIVSFGHN
ncbi:hypothetical protein ALI144C_13195 [Actinosynnema sp. ALI-1.44]|uniref:hypothetical protein n=1 Tax=Actinosynnema sp. ALI-1.44 TaxID=1933779 RepID=UPI00097C1F13|nr:hypothetical protein [Actinosynnema sp. ALI-1.44]ONI85263.1 hypothetical protein ALI144C_13195 [Actinosynnema sp. ALI-1.44]